MQGGGAATAWQAGALLPFIENPYIHISSITGTSGGALNGAILKHVFARHGQGNKGKERASSRLKDAWENHIAIDDLTARCVAFHQLINPVGHAMIAHANRSMFTQKLKDTLYTLLPDDAAISSLKGPLLSIQTVHAETNKGILYTGSDITREIILASAALKDCFDHVNGHVDGAYLGGANPPAPSLETLDKVDTAIYFMTTAQPLKILPKKQCDLTAQDFDEEQLIGEQAYGEIEYLKQQGYSVNVVAPVKSFTKMESGQTGRSIIQNRIKNGYKAGADKLNTVLVKALPSYIQT